MEEQSHRRNDDQDLPDDVMEDVLRRLAPRWIAASRCVCKHWRSVVDTRGLLRADLLPLSLHGIFIDCGWRVISEFFSRPASQISGRIDFLPGLPSERPDCRIDLVVRDHCNGLVLIGDYVANPATQRWDPLPEPPPDEHHRIAKTSSQHVVFDPTVSRHYEVIMVPGLPFEPETYLDLQSEWPPSPLVLRVFSSRSGRWEKRSFIRQGNAAATVGEICGILTRFSSAYWRGSLYVHSQYFFMRISVWTEHKYNVIELPVAMREDMDCSYYSSQLGKSEKGVYLASFHHHALHVWILDDELEWILKGKYSLDPVEAFNRQVYGPWLLQDSSYDMYGDHLRESTNKKPECQDDKFEWSSDNDDDTAVTNNLDDRGYDDDDTAVTNNLDDRGYGDDNYYHIHLLGFHPYKEIMFLSRFEDYERIATGLAYHLNKPKVEALGSIYPTHGDEFDMDLCNYYRFIDSSFPYTPCWIGELPNSETV